MQKPSRLHDRIYSCYWWVNRGENTETWDNQFQKWWQQHTLAQETETQNKCWVVRTGKLLKESYTHSVITRHKRKILYFSIINPLFFNQLYLVSFCSNLIYFVNSILLLTHFNVDSLCVVQSKTSILFIQWNKLSNH